MKKNIKVMLILWKISTFLMLLGFLSAVNTNAQQTKVVSIRAYSSIVYLSPISRKSSRTIFLVTAPNLDRMSTRLITEVANKWLTDNRENRVVEVLTGRFTSKIRGAYIWVIGNNSSLNVELVRAGACSAQSMFVDEADERKILVSRPEYEEFKKKIYEAESFAKNEKLGIWSKTE